MTKNVAKIPKFRLTRRAGSPYWQISWKLNGTRQGRSTGTTDRSEAERFLARHVLEWGLPAAKARNLTIAEIEPHYLEDCESRGVRMDQHRVKLRPIIENLGSFKPIEITPVITRRYVELRRQATRWGIEYLGPISDSTIRGELGALSGLMSYAVKNHMATTRQEIDYRSLEPSAPTPVFLELDEIRCFLDVCEGPDSWVGLWARLMLAGCCRPSAALALRWEHVGWPEDRYRGEAPDREGEVRPTLRSGGIVRLDVPTGKGNKRTAPYWTTSRRLYRALVEAHQRRQSDWVVERAGQQVIRANLRSPLQRLGAEAGLQTHVTPHVLKHSAVSLLMAQGVPTGTVSMLSGTSERVLVRVYGHRSRLLAQRLAEHRLVDL